MSETQDAHAEASARPPLDHRLRRMVGRDPNEPNRTATPLELLFDLTFVVAFSQAGAQTAHLLELGHWAPAIIGFLFAVFAIWWAWINYSWLASAYDNDDIFFRVATMVEMLGVLILALGLPALFHSLDEGEHVDNGVVVAGYVVMRVATIALWLRAAKHDTARRRTALDVRRLRLGHPARLDRAHLRQPAARADARVHGRADRPRARRAVRRGARPRGRHAMARAPHRRALRPARHHHPGRDHPRHDPRDLGRGRRAGLVGGDVAVAFGGTALAFGLWWVYFTMPSGKVLAAVPGARIRVGVPPLLHLRGARRRRRRAARGRVRDRGRRAHRHRAGAPDRRRPGRHLHGRAVHDLLAAAAAVRPVPHLAVHRQRARARARGGRRRGRRDASGSAS